MDLRDDSTALQEDLVQLRAELHQTPEIGLELPRTQEIVMRELDGLGLEVSTGTRTTSVIGVLRGPDRGQDRSDDRKTVLIRGDMDALPVAEETGLDFASTNGSMHACGHDLHTTALVGAARLLSAHRDHLDGDVVFMFQPGEEGFDGAGVMIDEGVLDAAGRRVDAAYGMHVLSNEIPRGLFVSKPGTVLSASHRLTVTVRGAGGHGSAPHRAKDPIIAAAAMITGLQTMVTRTFDIFDPVVITVGAISGGTKRNVIPDFATFEATVRRFSEATEETLTTGIERTLKGIAMSYGVDVDYEFVAEYPPTINTPEEVDFSESVIRELLGEERFARMEKPISGSEDFSRVIAAVPGAFVGIGACLPELDPQQAPMNHSPRADFSTDVLADAAAVYAALAMQRLTQLSTTAQGDAR